MTSGGVGVSDRYHGSEGEPGGVGLDEAGALSACASCHGTAQVRLDDRTGVPFCLECLDRAHDDQLEAGVVD